MAYQRKNEYGTLRGDQAIRIRELGEMGFRLKKVLVKVIVGKEIVKEGARGNW